MQVLMKGEKNKKKTPASNIPQKTLGAYVPQNDGIKSRKWKIQIQEIEIFSGMKQRTFQDGSAGDPRRPSECSASGTFMCRGINGRSC